MDPDRAAGAGPVQGSSCGLSTFAPSWSNPRAEKDNSTPATRVNASGVPASFVMPTVHPFRELLNKAVPEEPPEGSDPTMPGPFASIGIGKGKPFAPEARMTAILADTPNIGAVTARAGARHPGPRRLHLSGQPEQPAMSGLRRLRFQSQSGVSNLVGAIFDCMFATGATPAMEAKMVGLGRWPPGLAKRDPAGSAGPR